MAEDDPHELAGLRRAALEIFQRALRKVDARRAVERAISLNAARLRIFDAEFDLAQNFSGLYVVAAGKAACAMASALDESLGERITRAVISSTHACARLSQSWASFAGGHPLPNEESLAAGRAAFELLEEADREDALILFLISGGGSAMLEAPRDKRLTLEELREANRVLISCGASIAEVNSVRRALSAVKGGGLAARAPRAAQATLIVSDVNDGCERDVASGPTFPPTADAPAAQDVLEKYNLKSLLPSSILLAVEQHTPRSEEAATPRPLRRHYVLLDNRQAVEAASEAARSHGFATETARDLVEQRVDEGSQQLVARLFELYRREGVDGRGVCLVSGGEFACPVRGDGTGGRNAETALRCALELERLSAEGACENGPRHVVVLSAGTDGIDGNSPAAGALADDTTITRARALALDARQHLARSDAYTFFQTLGDSIDTGPTSTNVRDLRILIAK